MKYSVFKEGIEIIKSIIIGVIVQIISILWFFSSERFKNLFFKMNIVAYNVINVIIVKIIIVKL